MSDSTDELDYKAYSADAADRTRFQIALVERGIQTLMFMNGGAIVALFSLVGGKPGLVVQPRLLWIAFAVYVAGLVCGGIANFGAFLSQARFAEVSQRQAWDAQRKMAGADPVEDIQPPFRAGMRAQMIGIVAAAAGLAAFAIGSGFAFSGVLPG